MGSNSRDQCGVRRSLEGCEASACWVAVAESPPHGEVVLGLTLPEIGTHGVTGWARRWGVLGWRHVLMRERRVAVGIYGPAGDRRGRGKAETVVGKSHEVWRE